MPTLELVSLAGHLAMAHAAAMPPCLQRNRTPLFVASSLDGLPLIKLLLAAGADPNLMEQPNLMAAVGGFFFFSFLRD